MNKKYFGFVFICIALAPVALAREFKLRNEYKSAIKYREIPAGDGKDVPGVTETVILPGAESKETLDSGESYSIRWSGTGSQKAAWWWNVPIAEKLKGTDPFRKAMPILVVRAPGWTENPAGWGFDLVWDTKAWKNELSKQLTSGHTRAFGQGVLFTAKPLDNQAWNLAIADLEKFVNENGNSSLKDYFVQIKKANSSLLFVLSQKDKKSQGDLLEQIVKNMQIIGKELKSARFAMAGEKDTQDLLIHAALSIELTAAKAKKEIV